ncbi:glycosyltransferase [Pseudonocardia xishanensis]|uniref:glycosyltransferase n=1 Tax=Pseudonocardia xishanensis TaxID=630995 RepID=UPI0031E72B0A
MIAYYVHHQGSGHVHRAAAIARALDTPVIGLSSRPMPAGWPGEWVVLPRDDAGTEPVDATAGGTLHWAPLHDTGLRDRTAAIGAVLARDDVRLLVADVSVEVCLLARLHGVPVAILAQPGDRTDRPHRLAYDLAARLLAPWPDERVGWPAHWLAKTVQLGALSRFDGRTPAEPDPRRVLVLWGGGGLDVTDARVRAAAAATPDRVWELAGSAPDPADPPNLHRLGWVEDVWPALERAAVVVTHAGQNALAEVAAARRPAVVVPQDRPHHEQRATAQVLDRAGLAAVAPTWPEGAEWPALLARAERLGGAGWAGWSAGDGARRAAAELDALAQPEPDLLVGPGHGSPALAGHGGASR